MSKAKTAFTAAVFSLLGIVGSAHLAHADLSQRVVSTFKGQIIVTQDPVEAQDNDKKTIDEIKKVRLKEIKGDPNGEKVVTWHFQYTAFLNKSVAGTIKLEFFDGDHYVADRTLEGVNPKNAVISEQVEISEDDGPAKGKKYTLKMVVDGKGGGKDTILASTDLTMN